MYLQYYVLQYRNFLKILSDDFAHALSSGLTSKMPRRRTPLRLTAKETAHVNARSLQSFLWVIVNEFMCSIVSTNAEGRLLESAEERRGEEQRSRITRRKETF